MEEPIEQFRHKPLNLTTNSIRLIEVLPTPSRLFEANDSIQCTVRHATTDEEYVCLSYVWGSEDKNRTITVDGKSFEVRRNLWDFLRSASKRPRARTSEEADKQDGKELNFTSVWIDALCIDQANLHERNHQVQQMGSIYRNAQYVISWMGYEYQIANVLRGTYEIAGLIWFRASDYWTRAWITQETVLARNIYFLAALKAADVHTLIQGSNDEVDFLSLRNQSGLTACLAFHQRWKHNLSSLLDNMWRFRYKQCINWQDAVYSLLSISNDTANFQVSYDISKISLALEVMRMYREDFCICHARLVYQALRIDESDTKHCPSEMFAEYRVQTHLFEFWEGSTHRGRRFRCRDCRCVIADQPTFRSADHSEETVSICCLRCQHLTSRTAPTQGHLLLKSKSMPGNVGGQTELHWTVSWIGSLIHSTPEEPGVIRSSAYDEKLEIRTLDSGVEVLNIDEQGNAVLRFRFSTLSYLTAFCVTFDEIDPDISTRVRLGGKANPVEHAWKMLT